MSWFFRRMATAFLSGVGWKLGADAYDYVKRRIEESSSRKQGEADDADEAGPEATETVKGGPRC